MMGRKSSPETPSPTDRGEVKLEKGISSDLQQFYELELGALESAFAVGMEVAALSAFFYCRKHKLAVPGWAADAVYEYAFNWLKGEKHRGRGRRANPLARFKQDMIDFARWDAVVDARQKQVEVRKELGELEQLKNLRQSVVNEVHERRRSVGRSWDDAYVYAADMLSRSMAHGAPETIKASYQRVQRAHKDKRQHGKYRILDYATFRRLGLEDIFQ